MKKIAVLHAQIPFSHGGAEYMVENLTKELQIRGFQAEIVSIPFRWYPENCLYDNMLMWNMLNVEEINVENIDLVIPTKFPTYGVKHFNKVLWLMHQHRAAYDLYFNKSHFGLGTIENGEQIKKRIEKYDDLSFKDSKKIYTISKNVSKRLKEHNAKDSSELYHPPAMYGKYYCGKYDNYVLSVGRLDPLKRHDLLIRSLKYCDKNMQIFIVGRGKEEEKLKKLAVSEGVADQVKFCGYVEEKTLLELYANAKCVYFAPVDEDYGYVTLEAFLSRKPVITCDDSGGVLEFVSDHKSGIVCPCDPENLGNALWELFKNSTECKNLGNEGYEMVKDISWDHVVEKLTEGI